MSDQMKLGAGDAAPTEVTSHLRLREAILAWCDPSLITDLQAAERKLTFDEHAAIEVALVSERSTLRKPREFKSAGSADYENVRAAWKRLLQDLRNRLERGELFLEGVRLSPERGTIPEEISNSWAADMTFDVERNTVALGRDRFGNITVSTHPSPWAAVTDHATTRPHSALAAFPTEMDSTTPIGSSPPFAVNSDGLFELAPEDVGQLSDDTLLALLEEHASRVVENDTELCTPGRISVMPIIKRKMIHRASQGLLEKPLAAECRVLSEWINGRLPSHQAPTAKSIENQLRTEYASLKARSNGIKP